MEEPPMASAPAGRRDPVCGVDLGPAGSAYTFEYRGAAYQFCSAKCKEAFRTAPHRYVRVGLAGRVAALWRGLAAPGDGGGRCC